MIAFMWSGTNVLIMEKTRSLFAALAALSHARVARRANRHFFRQEGCNASPRRQRSFKLDVGPR